MEEFLKTELFGILTGYELLLLFHLFGLALGAGAAFFSDFLFSHILKDKKIDKKEYEILKLASAVVWIGLSVLIVSGFLIFLGASDRLLDSSKFLAKMSILAVLFANGILFHFTQIPRLGKYIGKDLRQTDFVSKYATKFFIGGAVSGVSWAAALVLGGLSRLDMSYPTIMLLYGAALVPAVGLSLLLKRLFFGKN